MTPTNENPNLFEGTSNIGDFTEALSEAITRGKETLEQDFLNWELVTIKGQDGGIVEEMKLTVVIRSTDGKNTAQYFQKQTAHVGGPVLMSMRADITAAEDSNLVFLRNNNEPIWLDLTVSTYCQWTFTLDPGVDEHQPPNDDANRQLQYARPGTLLAQRVASWLLTITNQTKEIQDYEGRVRLVQGTSIANGVEVYNHPIALQQLPPTTENPATPPAIMGRTLTFYAV